MLTHDLEITGLPKINERQNSEINMSAVIETVPPYDK